MILVLVEVVKNISTAAVNNQAAYGPLRCAAPPPRSRGVSAGRGRIAPTEDDEIPRGPRKIKDFLGRAAMILVLVEVVKNISTAAVNNQAAYGPLRRKAPPPRSRGVSAGRGRIAPTEDHEIPRGPRKIKDFLGRAATTLVLVDVVKNISTAAVNNQAAYGPLRRKPNIMKKARRRRAFSLYFGTFLIFSSLIE